MDTDSQTQGPKPRKAFLQFSTFMTADETLIPLTQLLTSWFQQRHMPSKQGIVTWPVSRGTFYLPTSTGANFKNQNLVPCPPRRKFGPEREAEMFTQVQVTALGAISQAAHDPEPAARLAKQT